MNHSLLKNQVLKTSGAGDYSETILLLPGCLRVSSKCKAEITENGVECVGCCNECHSNILRKEALRLGYKGVCIAPGGSMAVRYVKNQKPRGIVAVACEQELAEGVDIVEKHYRDKGLAHEAPVIKIIPLIKEGCVDTQVDLSVALESIQEQII